MARGPIHGFGRGTAREPLASSLYDVTVEFPPEAHKIFRYRSVAAQAIGYAVAPEIDYGIVPRVPPPKIAPGRYCLALHATARAAKLWPEESWTELVRHWRATPDSTVGQRRRARAQREDCGGKFRCNPPAAACAR
jgi:heptosyltransferase-1